jgi:hypothetical protein
MYKRVRHSTPILDQSDINSIATKYSLDMMEFYTTECLDCAGIGIELVKDRVETRRVTYTSQRDTGSTGGRSRTRRAKAKGIDL